jgi:RNA polymerase sigma factor (sigma-70 family)
MAHMTEVPTDVLARSLAAGDSAAFAELYDHLSERLYRYLVWLLGSRQDSEEALQETFARLARYRHRLASVEDIAAYAFTVAHSVARQAVRRRERRRRYETELPPDLPARTAQGELSEEVTRALNALPPAQREVVVLKVLEGMTAREIAKVTGRRQSTVESRLVYALEKLRRALAPAFPERAQGKGQG